LFFFNKIRGFTARTEGLKVEQYKGLMKMGSGADPQPLESNG